MICARRIFVAMIVAASSAGAQGTLSTQGFGYPPGELSTRALATGGGLALFDPQSVLNPAALGTSGDPLLFIQYDPEFRTITSGGVSEKTRTSRFPLVVAAIPIGRRATLGLSVSTLLDRSWETSTSRNQAVAGDVVTVTERVRSVGAINDVRLGGAWVPNDFLQLGVGAHVFTGQNKLFFRQEFPDSIHFLPLSQNSTLDYTGFAVSAGAVIHPSSVFAIALSGRKGGKLDARTGDTIVASAHIPDRYGAAVSYAGVPGATISLQVGRDLWSSINGLGSADARAVDTWDFGGGIEATGPRLLERVVLLRLGARYRTLPFLAAETEVRELSFAGGFGMQFARNRAAFDVAVQRSSRSPESSGTLGDLRERSYTLSFGLRVRP